MKYAISFLTIIQISLKALLIFNDSYVILILLIYTISKWKFAVTLRLTKTIFNPFLMCNKNIINICYIEVATLRLTKTIFHPF